MMQVFMIHWDEPRLEENLKRAREVLDTDITSITGINGIHKAHHHASTLARSDFFWCIDGDNWLTDDALDHVNAVEDDLDDRYVYVMRGKNPINGLIYGHGAVKLFPTNKVMTNMDPSTVDMTSSLNLWYKIVHRMMSIHEYNTSPMHTWRTAFRECVKLSSAVITNQKNDETQKRLDTWCDSGLGKDSAFYDENLRGAVDGKRYGAENRGSIRDISMINDFDWLRNRFNEQRDNS